MTIHLETILDKMLAKISKAISAKKTPDLTKKEMSFLEDTQELPLLLITKIANSPQDKPYLNACYALLGQALTQVRYNYERDEAWAKRLYNQIGTALCNSMNDFSNQHLIGIINAFYEARLEVPAQFKKQAMAILASDDDKSSSPEEAIAYGDATIQNFFDEYPDITAYELSDVLFESMHALPPAAVGGIVTCLTRSPHVTAQETAILFLLHPNPSVRGNAAHILSDIYDKETLTPQSLRRLITIRQWWPISDRPLLDKLIAKQRKRGLLFPDATAQNTTVRYEASMFDGSGVQLIFFEIKEGARSRIGGLLVKLNVGVRDAWIVPEFLSDKELRTARKKMQNEHSLKMLEVSEEYVSHIVSHYIAINNLRDETPEPHLLEIYETLEASEWRAESMNIDVVLAEYMQSLRPEEREDEWIDKSLQRSEAWMREEAFTHPWFETSDSIDAVINRHTTIIKGRKKVRFEEALEAISNGGFEYVREKWVELFLWMAMMIQSQPTPGGNLLWQDFITLAYSLQQNMPMNTIPLMQELMFKSLSISIDSMVERGGHLQQNSLR